MKTTTITQQASTMLGAVMLMLTVLCVLFIDTIYLTSSVRTIFVVAGIIGGLLLMSGMRMQTTVEVIEKKAWPVNELRNQQLVVHRGNIRRLRQLEDDMSRLARLEMRPDDTEAWNRVNEYILIRLGKEQNMLQSLEWDKEADNNKKAWDNHEKEAKLTPLRHYDKNSPLRPNPNTGEDYWLNSSGKPYTISEWDWTKLSYNEQKKLVDDNDRGEEVRG